MPKKYTKNNNQKLFYKTLSLFLLGLVFSLSLFSIYHAQNIKTHYSASQFQPKTHQLLQNDERIRQLYQIPDTSPHVLLLRLPKGQNWLEDDHFAQLKKLTKALEENFLVEKVISLANVQTAVVDEQSFYTGTLEEMLQSEKGRESIQVNTLLKPQLLSHSLRSTSVIVTPLTFSNQKHAQLMEQLEVLASIYLPAAQAYVGGPAAIRTEVSFLLSKEILIFMGMSLIGTIFILLFVFKGWMALPTTLIIVLATNFSALGIMSWLGAAFTVLSTTLPILVTITTVAITTHTLVRLGEEIKTGEIESRYHFILNIMKELSGPHLLTAITTMVGFGTLAFSDVPLIKEYGMAVAIVIPFAAIITLITLPALLFWLPIPETRSWLKTKSQFANFVMKYKWPLFISITLAFISFSFLGRNLHWTSRMFDDLPKNHSARKSTEFLSHYLGGIIPLEISIRSLDDKPLWKDKNSIHKLDHLVQRWRQYPGVGSAIGLSDFVKIADNKNQLPLKSQSLSEIYLVYGMSNENPLLHYLTPNASGTRLTLKFRDIPANSMQQVIARIKNDIQKVFPHQEVLLGGLAATIHPLNEVLSRDLMFGFFHAMIAILCLLSAVFKSWRWALVSALPNLVPPVVLLGMLALSKTPIKPSIALIFAISLGIAFDNTVYILGRLKEMLRYKKYDEIPVKELLTHEAAPCFVSSFSLFAGFSIFLLSYFSMNRIFGLFMLLSIFAGLIGDLFLLPSVLKLFPRLLFKPTSELQSKNMIYHSKNSIFNTTLSFVAATLLSVFLYSPELGAKATLNADHLLAKVKKLTSPPHETAEISMNIIEPDGSTKTRALTVMRKNTDTQKALVRITEPTDLKGVSLLSITEGDSEDQWLYLPTSKRSRRIVGSGKKGRFLDSELSYEDMSVNTYSTFNNKVLKTTGRGKHKIAIIESKSKKDTDATYDKIHTYIALPQNRIEKVEYYDKKGKLVKIMGFAKYQRVGKKYWRAGLVTVTNKQAKRSTQLELKKVQLNKLSDDQFTTTAME